MATGTTAVEYVVIILALLAFVAVILDSGALRLQTGPGATTVTVTASGSASSSADAAQLYLFVNATGNTTQLAVANLSSTLDSVNSTILKYINGNLSEISTEYFNVNKCYNYPYPSTTTISPPGSHNQTCAYVASETLLVTIPNVKNTTASLESLTSIPNVYVTDVAAKLTDQQISALRGQALAAAMANATGQATAVSPTGKVSTLNITVENFYVYPFQYSFGSLGTVTPTAAAGEIQDSLFYEGTSSVTESVTVVFAVQR
jgi:uncharacterized protein YggE